MASSPSQMYSEILRNDFNAFVHRSFVELHGEGLFQSNWHQEIIAQKLEEVRLGRCRRLIVNIQPRLLKSHAATVAFPAWVLGHDPKKKIMCLSYGQDVSDGFARESRALMANAFYCATFDTRLSPDRQSVGEFETTEGGSRFATSVGGVVTGRGADIIIVDDPIKPDEAMSDARRNGLNDWYDNTLRSRLNYQEEGTIIIVMQRLHADDIVAHVQKYEDWDVVSFPAIAEEDANYQIITPYGRRNVHRQEGDVLQPALMSRSTLDQLRASMTEYNFAAQYQQNPTPPGGNMVKSAWFKYYDPKSELKFDWYVQSWDTANKAEELSAFSVCTTWGVKGKDYYLLDVFRRRLNYPELKRALIAQHKRFPHPTIIIEDKASGVQLIQEFKREMRIKAYKPPSGTDKAMRLHIQTISFENGHVFLPREAPWLKEYRDELTGFPNAKYDDQVDSTTQFLDFINQPGSKPMMITQEYVTALEMANQRSRWRRRY